MTPKLKPGDRAPDFTLPAVHGGTVNLTQQLAAAPVTVVLFLCNHCPYVLAYIPRLIELQKQFDPSGPVPTPGPTPGRATARFIGICSNDARTYPEDSFEKMKTYAANWGLNFPYLHDEDQSIARAYGAERTPEVFLLDRQGICRYEGAIDDNYKDPAQVTQRPLRDAILAVASGQPVKEPQTHAIGCTIKWKAGA